MGDKETKTERHLGLSPSAQNVEDLQMPKNKQKRRKESPRMTYEWLKLAEKAANAGFYDWDMHTGELTWSEGLYQLFDLPASAEPSFQTWLARVHPDDRQSAMARINDSVERGIPLRNEYRIILQDGHERWINSYGNTFYDETGEPIRNCGICIDITERKEGDEKLRASEELFRTVFNGAYEGILVADVATKRFTLANESICRMLGHTPEEILSLSVNDIHPPEELFIVLEELSDMIGRKVSLSSDIPLVRKDGSVFYTEISSSPIRVEDKIYTVGFFRDTTEQRQAKKDLEESEAQARLLLDLPLDNVVILMDREGVVLDCNESLAKRFGVPRSEIVGKNHYDFLPPKLAASRRAKYDELLRNGKPLRTEDEDNGTFYENVVYPIFDPSGEITKAAVFAYDITDRKKVEEALREGEKRFRAIADYTYDWQDWVAPDGKLLWVNPSVQKLTGYSAEECMNMTDYPIPLIHEADRDEVDAMFKDAVQGGSVNDREFRVRCKDGSTTWVAISYHPIHYTDGTMLGHRASIRDITERKRMEEALQGANAELERRVRDRTAELSAAYDSLKREMEERRRAEDHLRQAQKMEAIGTLAGGIAHDFNNILAAVIGFTEIAMDDAQDRPLAATSLQKVMKSALRARDLIRQILTFARKTSHDRSPLSLTPILKETVQLLKGSIPPIITIRFSTTASSDTVLASPTEIQQILMNLVTNASLAMEENGGSVKISLTDVDFEPDSPVWEPHESPEEYIQIAVKDTGVGMSPEVMRRVFDPFFTTRGRGKGTGMGLSVVHGIVKDLQGKISVESKPGKGSTFRVFLPKVKAQGERAAIQDFKAPRGNERILFIDDEKDLVEPLGEALRKLGYKVSTFTDPQKALKAFSSDPSFFDLVITDQAMPQMTGTTLVRKLLDIRSDLPVLLFTGLDEMVTNEKVKECGITELLMKPLLREEVAVAIRRVLDRNRSTS